MKMTMTTLVVLVTMMAITLSITPSSGQKNCAATANDIATGCNNTTAPDSEDAAACCTSLDLAATEDPECFCVLLAAVIAEDPTYPVDAVFTTCGITGTYDSVCSGPFAPAPIEGAT
ncbi:hypothetical protein vseg_016841 [Gypsophila vaccaria]